MEKKDDIFIDSHHGNSSKDPLKETGSYAFPAKSIEDHHHHIVEGMAKEVHNNLHKTGKYAITTYTLQTKTLFKKYLLREFQNEIETDKEQLNKQNEVKKETSSKNPLGYSEIRSGNKMCFPKIVFNKKQKDIFFTFKNNTLSFCGEVGEDFLHILQNGNYLLDIQLYKKKFLNRKFNLLDLGVNMSSVNCEEILYGKNNETFVKFEYTLAESYKMQDFYSFHDMSEDILNKMLHLDFTISKM